MSARRRFVHGLLWMAPLLFFVGHTPVLPFEASCVSRYWFSWPPRMHPSAVAVTSESLAREGWIHATWDGRIFLAPLSWITALRTPLRDGPPSIGGWADWVANEETAIVSQLAYGTSFAGRSMVTPPNLLSALMETQAIYQENSGQPNIHQRMNGNLFGNCAIQRAGFFNVSLLDQRALCQSERDKRLGWCR